MQDTCRANDPTLLECLPCPPKGDGDEMKAETRCTGLLQLPPGPVQARPQSPWRGVRVSGGQELSSRSLDTCEES